MMRTPSLQPALDKSRRRHGAFTLPELLVVIGIIAILIALSAPLMSTIKESTSLTQGGQLLGDQINLARQIAAAHNKSVEVRLIQTSNVNARDGYDAIQLWTVDNLGVPSPVNRLVSLPREIVISDKASFSPAMTSLPADTFPSDSSTLPGAKYKAFRIKPNGIVSPSIAMTDFSVLIVQAKKALGDERPDNYVAVQVNPLTGTTSYYRP